MANMNAKAMQDRQKATIDMVTKLYVYTLKSDNEISDKEIGILYSILTNLFAHVDVSWEAYVGEVINSEYKIEEVLEYLNKHLSKLDKVRLLQSLVILAKTEGELRVSEITEILDFCKKLELNPEGFVNLIDYFESSSSGDISISCEHSVSHVRYSLFSDYVVFGSSLSADIRFRNNNLAAYEMSLYSIDNHLFIALGSISTLKVNEQPAKPNSIILLHPDSAITVGNMEFSHSCLLKIYGHRDANDEIVFHKSSYDFIVTKRGLWYSLGIRGGSIALNGKEMLHNKRYEIYYDDTLQIHNYAPWNLTVLIENRSSIGLDDLVPKSLYINHERDFFDLSRVETEKSLAYIEGSDGVFYLHPPKPGWKIYVNQKLVEDIVAIALNSDTISINNRNFRINSFYDLIETPFEIKTLSIADVKHYFPDGQLALDSISCTAKKGSLIGILGQSGCGKSTLVKILSGEIKPTYGQLLVDGKDLYSNVSYYLEFFGYVPQDDLLYPYLTVYENLWYRLRLRMPTISAASLEQKINNILHQVNLTHQRDTKVGDFKKKNLSGGERKRLNIALELLFEPTVIICDEPTSGLSFTDAEQIIDILSSLTNQGKIVIITIHQPNSSIYRKFDQVVLMDMGGRMAYFGTPKDCFSYFDEELSAITVRASDIEKKKQLMTSDFMYDVITYPEYNEFNEPVYEQINKYIQPKRKFSPEYWRDKYKRKMLYELIHHDIDKPSSTAASSVKRKRPKQSFSSRLVQMAGYIGRGLKMKFRNRTNNYITFIQAPLLGLVIGFILRYTPQSPPYMYSANNNIGIYIFVSVIAFIFLGISNSIEEILDERKMILRETQMNLKISFYQLSKLITLSLFVVIQALLYYVLSAWVLEIKGLFSISILYLFLSGFTGVSLGLLCSAFIKEKKAIINLLPLVLIPQIIFGGAVIEFERMNRNLTIYHKHPIPEIVQTIPSRWLFEGMATAYAKNTAFHSSMANLEKKKLTQLRRFKEADISASEYNAMKGSWYHEKVKIADRWNPDEIMNSYLNASVSIMDGVVLSQGKNVFLSSFKIGGRSLVRTWNYNVIVLFLYFLLFNCITAVKLKYYFKE